MSRHYATIPKDTAVKVRKEGRYPWPCDDLPDRTIELAEDDVLTKTPNGKYMKHTGLGCFNIVLTDDQVEPIGKDVDLYLIY